MGNDLNKLKLYAGNQTRLARILGLTPEHVSRMVNGSREIPEYVAVIAELIDKLPPEHWPKRWRHGAR